MLILLLIVVHSNIAAMESSTPELQSVLRYFRDYEEDEKLFLTGIQLKNTILITKFIQLRKTEGIDINQSILDLPPLHASADADFMQASKLLLEAKSDPNTIDKHTGLNALYYARKMSPEHIKLFIRQGARVTDATLNEVIDYITYYQKLYGGDQCPTAHILMQKALKAAAVLSDQKFLQNYPQKSTLARAVLDRQIGR